MSPCELTLLVTAIANELFKIFPENQLSVLAAVFTQLGDTLETLAAQQNAAL